MMEFFAKFFQKEMYNRESFRYINMFMMIRMELKYFSARKTMTKKSILSIQPTYCSSFSKRSGKNPINLRFTLTQANCDFLFFKESIIKYIFLVVPHLS